MDGSRFHEFGRVIKSAKAARPKEGALGRYFVRRGGGGGLEGEAPAWPTPLIPRGTLGRSERAPRISDRGVHGRSRGLPHASPVDYPGFVLLRLDEETHWRLVCAFENVNDIATSIDDYVNTIENTEWIQR